MTGNIRAGTTLSAHQPRHSLFNPYSFRMSTPDQMPTEMRLKESTISITYILATEPVIVDSSMGILKARLSAIKGVSANAVLSASPRPSWVWCCGSAAWLAAF
jgi:hypothetical protein